MFVSQATKLDVDRYVDCYVSLSYWMMIVTCHILIGCQLHERLNALLFSLNNKNMPRDRHHLISDT